jgi:1-acyl-sn-glycerol-3-phosphate acyltransferase
MMGHARALWRLARVLMALASGVWTMKRHQGHWSETQRSEAVTRWAQHMLQAMGVDLHIQGEPQPGPLLWVANHIAWLDILSLHAVRQCRFVAKSEVHRWPIIGALAAGAGTLFIERASRRDALRVVHDMASALDHGDTLAVFPEGTTGLGDTVLPFHANLLQAAVTTGSPIQPVLIRYENAQGQPASHVRYVEQDTLVGSIWRVLSAPVTVVRLQFLPLQQNQNRDRRAWSEDLRGSLLEALR